MSVWSKVQEYKVDNQSAYSQEYKNHSSSCCNKTMKLTWWLRILPNIGDKLETAKVLPDQTYSNDGETDQNGERTQTDHFQICSSRGVGKIHEYRVFRP